LGTKDRIAEAQRAAEERALLEIFPRALHDNAMLDDRLAAPLNDPLLQLNEDKSIFIARSNGVARAALIPITARDGYSGAIELIVGVKRDGSVAGVRVLQHRETPGLGDAVDHRKSDWIESLRERSLSDPPLPRWTVRKDGGDFDQFTGATITPRAVVRATARALQYAQANHARLFGETQNDAVQNTAANSKVLAQEAGIP
jgi:electron transport complex protein RnfG